MIENMTSIDNLKLNGRNVFIRVDFNVPIDENHKVTDDTRIREALPTIRKAMDSGAKVILASHLGRPKGNVDPAFSLKPVAKHLSGIIGQQVIMAPDCIGDEVKGLVNKMDPGEVMLLENLRFHEGEKKNTPEFADQLASFVEVYINDAFGTAHRAHASMVGIPARVKDKGYGYLMAKEIKCIGETLAKPERPFLTILGGAKVADKIGLINNLVAKVNYLVVGGALAYTLLKAAGHTVGNSIVEDDQLDVAKKIIDQTKARGVELLLPVDHVVAPDIDHVDQARTISSPDIPDGMKGFDIGPETVDAFIRIAKKSRTIVWNGPLGLFEKQPFGKGTYAVLDAVVETEAFTIVGGGDIVSAVKKSPNAFRISHISTGGGSCIEFLEGKELPGIKALYNT